MKNILKTVIITGLTLSSTSCVGMLKENKKDDAISIKSTDPNIIFLEKNNDIMRNITIHYVVIYK